VLGVRGRSFHRLFQIHQAIIFCIAIDLQQSSITGTTQRAATFHPIGGVNEFYFFVFVARARTGSEAVHFFIRHEPFDVAPLLQGEGPKALPNWESWARAFEVLRGERFPRCRGGFFRDTAYRLRLFEVAVLIEIMRESAMVLAQDPLEHTNRCEPR
jgi:hypothetical protein